MAITKVVDRGHGHQRWRVAVNVLNNKSQTAYSRWPSSLGVECVGGTNSHCEKIVIVMKCFKHPWKRTDNLARLKHRKMDMRFEM
jgi:hypothetical protein